MSHFFYVPKLDSLDGNEFFYFPGGVNINAGELHTLAHRGNVEKWHYYHYERGVSVEYYDMIKRFIQEFPNKADLDLFYSIENNSELIKHMPPVFIAQIRMEYES